MRAGPCDRATAALPMRSAMDGDDRPARQASEGLFVQHDPRGPARFPDPGTGPPKTYTCRSIGAGCRVGWRLRVRGAVERRTPKLGPSRCPPHGNKNAWREIVLDAGSNRQIRRLLEALDVSVTADGSGPGIGSLALGALAKGRWAHHAQSEERNSCRLIGNRPLKGFSRQHRRCDFRTTLLKAEPLVDDMAEDWFFQACRKARSTRAWSRWRSQRIAAGEARREITGGCRRRSLRV